MISDALGDLTEHPRLTGFETLYQSDILPELAKFEEARQEAMRKLPWAAAPLLIAVIGFAMQNQVVMIVGAGGAVLLGLFFWQGVAKAKGDHTVFVASKVCAFFGLTYNRTPRENVIPWFRNLGLLPSFDRRKLEDEIEGYIDDAHIYVQEIELEERRTRRDSKGRRKTYYVTVFKGLLFLASFPKAFKGTTVLASDSGVFNFLSGLGKGGERVGLESEAFEKRFEVRSTDQVESRYLLTPTFMERMVAVHDTFGGRVEAAFDDDSFLMAVRTSETWFEAEGQTSDLTDPTATVDMIKDILMLYDLVDDLNLSAKTRV